MSEEVYSQFDLLIDQYGQWITKDVFPNFSVYGKSLNIYLVGNRNARRVMIDGACHGNERVGTDILLAYVKWLLAETEPEASDILRNNLTIIVPIVNIDGFPSTRKNMNGVDLNRNFDWNWDGVATTGGGVSDDPTHPNYRGSYALSEPECRNYKKIWQKYLPTFYLNLHQFGPEQVWHIRGFPNPLPTPIHDYITSFYSKYSALATSRGQLTPPLYEDGGTGNYPCESYYEYGIIGWSNEVSPVAVTSEELPTVLNYWLPFFITMSMEAQVIPPPQPPSILVLPIILAGCVLLGIGLFLVIKKR